VRGIRVQKALGGPPTPPFFVQGLFPRVRRAGTLYSKALLPTMATPAPLSAPATPPKLKFTVALSLSTKESSACADLEPPVRLDGIHAGDNPAPPPR
jgi:hypothetical protein